MPLPPEDQPRAAAPPRLPSPTRQQAESAAAIRRLERKLDGNSSKANRGAGFSGTCTITGPEYLPVWTDLEGATTDDDGFLYVASGEYVVVTGVEVSGASGDGDLGVIAGQGSFSGGGVGFVHVAGGYGQASIPFAGLLGPTVPFVINTAAVGEGAVIAKTHGIRQNPRNA